MIMVLRITGTFDQHSHSYPKGNTRTHLSYVKYSSTMNLLTIGCELSCIEAVVWIVDTSMGSNMYAQFAHSKNEQPYYRTQVREVNNSLKMNLGHRSIISTFNIFSYAWHVYKYSTLHSPPSHGGICVYSIDTTMHDQSQQLLLYDLACRCPCKGIRQ